MQNWLPWSDLSGRPSKVHRGRRLKMQLQEMESSGLWMVDSFTELCLPARRFDGVDALLAVLDEARPAVWLVERLTTRRF